MSTFNETRHPRNHPTGASRFSDKRHNPVESELEASPATALAASTARHQVEKAAKAAAFEIENAAYIASRRSHDAVAPSDR